jgi:hypothetical protein
LARAQLAVAGVPEKEKKEEEEKEQKKALEAEERRTRKRRLRAEQNARYLARNILRNSSA